ncbi:MAG: RNA degradosome polyphosphate kinase [Acidimicrobiia bacterium]|nr:RNA degradosome polyphosphate kinase [Acidimicrobiia bacterium]
MDHGPDRLLNRELSWIDFDERVLALACDSSVPIIERAKFLAIASQNLDEFFQVRVAGLMDQVAAGLSSTSPDGRTPAQQLLEIADRTRSLVRRMERVFLEEVVPELSRVGIRLSAWDELDEDDRKHMDEEFENRIFPVLTPLAVDPGHPFPYISTLSLNLAVIVRDPVTEERRFARVKVPQVLPRFVVMPDGERFVPLEQVIAAHLDQLFPGMIVEEHFAFRVTRNADLTLEEEEADDLLAAVEIELRRRRFGRAVRLEIASDATDEVRTLLLRELDLDDEAVYEQAGPLDLGGLWALQDLDRPDLKDEPWVAVTQPRLQAAEGERVDLFATLADRDVLVHLPYDSFTSSVDEFIRQAAADPKVLTIKLTLYRTSGDSSIITSLIRAAERGKQVATLVELKARFDEANNIEWARALEEAGVHVTYGLVGLKTHTKTALVVREEGDGVRRYFHLGTGNYNEKTAKVYEDLGLLSADPDVGSDLTQLFNYLTGYGRNVRYRKLLVAPHTLRHRIEDLIRNEMAAPPGTGRIIMKMNALVDPAMIDLLYEASAAGVEIDLVIRGICCLRPGVPGLSERIRVRSIVGRYLEHSRIYLFGNGAGEGATAMYIGSADLMPRNLDRRVEALVPIADTGLQRRLREVLDVNLDDDTLAWVLEPDGSWHHVDPGGTVDTHRRLQQLALIRSRRQESNALDRPGPRQGHDGEVRAAGGVVWREGEQGVEVLLVHRPRYDDWSHPKGKCDEGETDEACALREVEEETGLRCELGEELASTAYRDRHGRPKRVRYWSMRPITGNFTPIDEVDQIRWLPVDDARDVLTYGHDVSVLDSLVSGLGSPASDRD